MEECIKEVFVINNVIDFNVIDNLNKSIKIDVFFNFIKQLCERNELWEGNLLKNIEVLSLIMDIEYWKVRLKGKI